MVAVADRGDAGQGDRLQQLPNWVKIAIIAAVLIGGVFAVKAVMGSGEQDIRDAQIFVYRSCMDDEKLKSAIADKVMTQYGATPTETVVSAEAMKRCMEKAGMN